MSKLQRNTVDLSAYPDLVVIHLGMRVNALSGLATLLSFGPKIQSAVNQKPDGLLLHEQMLLGLLPPHFGMRQYWRDFESLEKWARALPHQQWWQEFMKGGAGVGFWHETYFMRGGMEAIYDDMQEAVGFSAFAPRRDAQGPMFSARSRAAHSTSTSTPPPA